MLMDKLREIVAVGCYHILNLAVKNRVEGNGERMLTSTQPVHSFAEARPSI